MDEFKGPERRTSKQFVELTSFINGKRIKIRKDDVSSIFESGGMVKNPDPKANGAMMTLPDCVQLSMKNGSSFPVKEKFDEVNMRIGQ